MLIIRRDPFTGKTNSKDLPITIEEMRRWKAGEFIQNVWPHLSADDREFIKSRIFDWDAVFEPQPPEPRGKTEDVSIVDDYDIIAIAPETPEDKFIDLLADSPEDVPVKTVKEWSPPSKKVYQTKNFAAHKIKQLRPIFPYLDANTILAGGSLRTILNCAAEKVSDFDLFFKTFQGVTALREKLLDNGWSNTFSCPENKLFSYKKGEHKIQLICEREYFSPIELIESFDLTSCVAAYHEGAIFFTREFVRSVFKKQARIQNVSFPVATIKRIVKYAQKGYGISLAAEDLARLMNNREFIGDDFRRYID